MKFSSQKRLIYGVHHAITSGSDGYSIRSHGLAKALSQEGVALWVLVAYGDASSSLPFHVVFENVNYLHLQIQTPESYREILKIFKPDAVLAASNWSHAKPIQQATKMLGLPFWYEARGFWELSECARDPCFAASKEFREELAGETAIAQASDRLFTLNRQMAAEWMKRGIPAAKVHADSEGTSCLSFNSTLDGNFKHKPFYGFVFCFT